MLSSYNDCVYSGLEQLPHYVTLFYPAAFLTTAMTYRIYTSGVITNIAPATTAIPSPSFVY